MSEPARGRRRLSYANVMSTLAVVLVLTTGTAYAAGLAQNSVRTGHIVNGQVRGADLATGAVAGRQLLDDSVGNDDLAPDSVGKSALKSNAVDTYGLQDGQVRNADIASGAVTPGKLHADVLGDLRGGTLVPTSGTTSAFTVSSGSWPGGAPSSGGQITATWSQPANVVDLVTITARVEYPSACSATASAPGRGFDVKVVGVGGRVISASSPEYTEGVDYNGNGFWAEQADLPGVSYRAPFGSDLAASPQGFVDYLTLPLELPYFVNGSSTTSRTIRAYFKRNSSACSPEISNVRVLVFRYA
jgi:hypothetical protein